MTTEKVIYTAPLKPDEIMHVMRNRNTGDFVIHVEKSLEKLSPQSLLTWMTNFNADLGFHFGSLEGYFTLLKAYLKSPMFHHFPQLEQGALDVLLQIKNIPNQAEIDYHTVIMDPEMKSVISRWLSLVESLSLFALRYTQEASALEKIPKDDSRDLVGINIARLLLLPDLPLALIEADPSRLRYYTHFFEEPIYQGSVLANYWENINNPLFVMALTVDQGLIEPDQFVAHYETDVENHAKVIANTAPGT